MTATFFDREPDDVKTINIGQDVQYLFNYYDPSKGRQVGAHMVAVYSPGRYKDKWRTVKFYIAGVAAYQVVAERELTDSEIACFEERVKEKLAQ